MVPLVDRRHAIELDSPGATVAAGAPEAYPDLGVRKPQRDALD